MSKLFESLAKRYDTPIGRILLGAIIGSVITLLFFPFQQQIEHYFWEKQNKQLLSQSKIEKRLTLLDDFTVEYTRYEWCSIRVGVINTTGIIEEEPIVCFMNSSANLAGLAFQAKYYFDEPVTEKIDEIASAIQVYEEDVHNGKLDANSKDKLDSLFNELMVLMQERILADINN